MMRTWLMGACLLLAACGYPGEPRPPALNRPVPITDLAAVQHGDKILIHFTVPTRTTEDLPIRGTPDVEVRMGPAPPGRFEFPAWERGSERIPVTAPGTAGIDASRFTGKTEIIGVRVHGPHGQDAGWSKLEVLTPVQPLAMPQGLEAKDAPDAVRLDWHAAAPQFRVLRKAPADVDWAQIAITDKPLYSDDSIEYGKTYQYMVQSVEKSGEKYAESDLSAMVEFRPADHFPPATPAGLMAIPGTRTIELVWDRNAEKDFSAYRVYRDGKRVTDGLTAPAFSDPDVKAGTTYKYQISALDTAGNESALSAAVEAAIP
ncbi:MAG: hypothetical protein M3N54_07865 [Acidobacteriota bacterium]|nr:hypothetical protein [Acidobacteriota bacterium]